MPRLDLGISQRHFHYGTRSSCNSGAGMVALRREMPRSSLSMTVIRSSIPARETLRAPISKQREAAPKDLPALMRDELPPVGQGRQRQRLAIIRIVDPHQTRMDRKARRLDYADNLPNIGIRGTRL